ncbi:MAG: DUF4290 domain-containing protein [Bacteroidales bacterium]|jgi:hypothetical protein|nr:DUF4290 domain-containing protein [Bacteroidales bacterium]
MEYNTTRNKLMNGEYGRHIQRMIEYAIGVKDRDLRNQQAQAIVRTMSCFSHGSKDTQDYWYKLWDQLFVISGFRLDVDSPFPKPTPEKETRPNPLPYPKHNIRIRTYGLLIEEIIKKISLEENSDEKEQTIANVANYLKKQYLNWNRDSVSDTLIIEHLETLSKGKLKLKENFKFSSTREILNDIASSNNNNGIAKKKNKKKKKPTTAATPAVATNNNKNSTNRTSPSANRMSPSAANRASSSNNRTFPSNNRGPSSNNNNKNKPQNK